MNQFLCIGPAYNLALVELPLLTVDVLLDFIIDREELDDVNYRKQLNPLMFPVTEGPGDPDHLDVWSSGKGWPKKTVLSTLQLCVELLDCHGEKWRQDPDWLPAGLELVELKQLLNTAVECIQSAYFSELLTWVQC